MFACLHSDFDSIESVPISMSYADDAMKDKEKRTDGQLSKT
jgi:hypothetical protein